MQRWLEAANRNQELAVELPALGFETPKNQALWQNKDMGLDLKMLG